MFISPYVVAQKSNQKTSFIKHPLELNNFDKTHAESEEFPSRRPAVFLYFAVLIVTLHK